MNAFDHQSKSEVTRPVVTPRTNVYLSLYLVIFGFFVVLVNDSELSSEKSSEALSSVKETFFQNKQEGVALRARAPRNAQGADTFLNAVASLAQTEFPSADLTFGPQKQTLTIRLDAETLFVAKTAAVQRDARLALAALSDLLSQTAGAGTVSVIVPRREGVSPDQIAARPADIRRAQVIASLLETGAGGPAGFVGYADQPSGIILISIDAAPMRITHVSGRRSL